MTDFTQRITRAKNGDHQLIDQLLAEWRPWLRAQARGILRGAAAARLDSSDVVQLTLVAAYRNLQQFRGMLSADFTRGGV